MASMLRKIGLSSRESSQERDSSKKETMKLDMKRSPLFDRRTSHDHQIMRDGGHEPLPDVLHGSTGAPRARVKQAGLTLDIHNSVSQPSYPVTNTYEPVQRRDRDSEVSWRSDRSFGVDVGRNNIDSCLSPLTPITPLSPNSLGSPFLSREQSNVRPIAFATPQLRRKVSNAVVFDSAKSMMKGNGGIDDSAIAFEVVHSPRKAIARSLSSTPHPPVTPTEYASTTSFPLGRESSGQNHSASGSLSSLSQYEDLSISGVSSVLSRSDSTDRDSDNTYQTVNRSNTSSQTGSTSSLYTSPVQTSDERRKISTSRPPNLPTGLPTRKDSQRSHTFRPALVSQPLPASGTSTSGHLPPQSDVASLREDLANINCSKNFWSEQTNNRYTQFLSRDFAALSMLPEEEIIQLFRKQFTKNISLEETLHEEPPSFVPPPPSTKTAKGYENDFLNVGV